MMLFGERTSLETENQVEEDLFDAPEVTKKENKEHNYHGSTNIFNPNIDFQHAVKEEYYEKKLRFLEARLATPCIDKLYIEHAETKVENNTHDENINDIFIK